MQVTYANPFYKFFDVCIRTDADDTDLLDIASATVGATGRRQLLSNEVDRSLVPGELSRIYNNNFALFIRDLGSSPLIRKDSIISWVNRLHAVKTNDACTAQKISNKSKIELVEEINLLINDTNVN